MAFFIFVICGAISAFIPALGFAWIIVLWLVFEGWTNIKDVLMEKFKVQQPTSAALDNYSESAKWINPAIQCLWLHSLRQFVARQFNSLDIGNEMPEIQNVSVLFNQKNCIILDMVLDIDLKPKVWMSWPVYSGLKSVSLKGVVLRFIFDSQFQVNHINFS